MRFGIIVCPKCKKSKAVDLSNKTTKCVRCNKNLKLKEMKILFETDSQRELRKVIGLVNAEIDGRIDDFKELTEDKKIY